jgi:hypothetical protein
MVIFVRSCGLDRSQIFNLIAAAGAVPVTKAAGGGAACIALIAYLVAAHMMAAGQIAGYHSFAVIGSKAETSKTEAKLLVQDFIPEGEKCIQTRIAQQRHILLCQVGTGSLALIDKTVVDVLFLSLPIPLTYFLISH